MKHASASAAKSLSPSFSSSSGLRRWSACTHSSSELLELPSTSVVLPRQTWPPQSRVSRFSFLNTTLAHFPVSLSSSLNLKYPPCSPSSSLPSSSSSRASSPPASRPVRQLSSSPFLRSLLSPRGNFGVQELKAAEEAGGHDLRLFRSIGSASTVSSSWGCRRFFASEREQREQETDKEEEERSEEIEDAEDEVPAPEDDDSLQLMQQMADSFNQRPTGGARRNKQPHAVHVVDDLSMPSLSSAYSASPSSSSSSASLASSSLSALSATPSRSEETASSGPAAVSFATSKDRHSEVVSSSPPSSSLTASPSSSRSSGAESRDGGGNSSAKLHAGDSSSMRAASDSQEENWGRSRARDEMLQDETEFVVVDVEKLREESKLNLLPVQQVLRTLVDTYPGMYVWRDGFVHTVKQLLAASDFSPPQHVSDEALNQAFDFLDRSNNEIIDLLEAVRGLPQLCRASHEDRIKALFELFDRRRSRRLHFDEVMEVFCFIYRVILTPSMVCQLKEACLHFTTIDDLALHTTQQLFSRLRPRASSPQTFRFSSISFRHGNRLDAASDEVKKVHSKANPDESDAAATAAYRRPPWRTEEDFGCIDTRRAREADPVQRTQNPSGRESPSLVKVGEAKVQETVERERRDLGFLFEQSDPWRQAQKRREEFISYREFKEICASLPPSVGLSRASLLELPLIVLVRDVSAPPRSHVVIRRRRRKPVQHGAFAWG
ncbi:UNVERIFIED_CONTAM: hypothetical protein HHA_319540 [Hammondia hammondi]|eukprot:XP_008885204.1 hypothetical protein HHA_319540 [Hammondia hammondi]